MSDRTTTVSTVAAALVAAGAVLCGALPAGAVTPTPGATPSTSASASAPAPGATPGSTPSTSASQTPPPATRTTAPAPTRSSTPTPGATPSRSVPPPAPTRTPGPTTPPPPPPAPVIPPPVGTALSSISGHAARSRTVTMTGSQLQNLRAVQVAGQAVPNLVVLSPTSARFTLPSAADYQAKTAAVTLTSIDGVTRPTTLTFTYRVKDRIDRQMAYAFQNWNVYSNPTFGYLAGNDCANFASQTLLARGWKRGPQWFNNGVGRWSSTWVSSTALSTWLKQRPDLATRLPYRQRDQAAVGDIVQFRWPGHKKGYSSWDHTGIVSKVVVLPNGRHDVYYTSHTLNRQYGGSTDLFARVMAKDLRIQFFHLK